MEDFNQNSVLYKNIRKALKELDLEVEEILTKGKKTVISVHRNQEKEKKVESKK